jgi:hypothetical protein
MVKNGDAYTPKTILIDVKDKKTGQVVAKVPYLKAHDAILMFRTENPAPRSAIITHINAETRIVRAEIYLDNILVSTGHTMGGQGSPVEKLETGAVRRALANLGYGTIAALAVENDEGYDLTASSDARVAMSLEDTTIEDNKQQLAPSGGLTGKERRIGATPATSEDSAADQEDDPAPEPEAQSPPEPIADLVWPCEELQDRLIRTINAEQGVCRSIEQIQGLAGVDKKDPYSKAGWGQYPTYALALEQVRHALKPKPSPKKKKDKDTPGPTNGKTLFHWTNDDAKVRQVYDWATTNFKWPDAKTDEVLMEMAGNGTYPTTIHEAMGALLAHKCFQLVAEVEAMSKETILRCDSETDRKKICMAAKKYCTDVDVIPIG